MPALGRDHMGRKPASDFGISVTGMVLVLLLGGLMVYIGSQPMSYGHRLAATDAIAASLFGDVAFVYWKVIWPKR